MRRVLGLLTVFIVTLAGSCGGTVTGKIGEDGGEGGLDTGGPIDGGSDAKGRTDSGVDAGGRGDGGCLEETPTQGSPCTAAEVLCHPGNECCSGRWTCDPMTHQWDLVRANCACFPDAGGDSSTSTGHFACGPSDTCDAATQYCLIVNSPVGHTTTYSCETPDGGGAPSCHGSSLKSPGCGCYQSPIGEVTITECPP
jgi:hypothetical protein